MKSKTINRIRNVALLSGSNLLVPFISFVLSVLIIRLCSKNLWGEIVNVTLWMGLALQLSSWGNKEFLLREFSKAPREISALYQQSLLNRLWLLPLFMLVVFFLHVSFEVKTLLALWFLSRFIYQSFDSLIVFERSYRFVFVSEIMGFLVTVIPVFILQERMSLTVLILFFTVSAFMKCAFGLFYFRKTIFTTQKFSFAKNYLRATFPFLMIGLSGMLYAKTDQYCVALLLNKTELASYFVFTSFLGFAQYSSTFLLSPFTKNIFRMKQSSLKRLQQLMILSGAGFSIMMILATFFAMAFFYKFDFSWQMYVLGTAYIYPFFIFQLRIVKLMKENRQRKIIMITLAAGLINLIFNFLLTPVWKLEGALLSGVIAEWVMVAIYFSAEFFRVKKSA